MASGRRLPYATQPARCTRATLPLNTLPYRADYTAGTCRYMTANDHRCHDTNRTAHSCCYYRYRERARRYGTPAFLRLVRDTALPPLRTVTSPHSIPHLVADRMIYYRYDDTAIVRPERSTDRHSHIIHLVACYSL